MVTIRLLIRRVEAALCGAVAGSLLLLVLSSLLTRGGAIGPPPPAEVHWSDMLILVSAFLLVTLVAVRLQAALMRLDASLTQSPVLVAMYAAALPLSSAFWLGIFEGLEGLSGVPAVGTAIVLSLSCAIGGGIAQMMDPGPTCDR